MSVNEITNVCQCNNSFDVKLIYEVHVHFQTGVPRRTSSTDLVKVQGRQDPTVVVEASPHCLSFRGRPSPVPLPSLSLSSLRPVLGVLPSTVPEPSAGGVLVRPRGSVPKKGKVLVLTFLRVLIPRSRLPPSTSPTSPGRTLFYRYLEFLYLRRCNGATGVTSSSTTTPRPGVRNRCDRVAFRRGLNRGNRLRCVTVSGQSVHERFRCLDNSPTSSLRVVLKPGPDSDVPCRPTPVVPGLGPRPRTFGGTPTSLDLQTPVHVSHRFSIDTEVVSLGDGDDP